VLLNGSNKLSSFDAADLVVYKNKESFDKRNTRVEPEREEPLEVDAVVEGLGTTKNEALIVLVPSSDYLHSSVAAVTYDLTFSENTA
jgi:acetyl-CoA carboxylase beta subunit